MSALLRVALVAALVFSAAPAGAQQDGEASSPAYQAAARAYAAAERGSNEEALREARIAARLAPNNRDYQLLLFNLLVANGQREEALGVADALVRRFGTTPAFDVQRAALLAELERRAEARTLLDSAIRSRGFDAQEERSARITLADAAQADNDPAAALAALEPLRSEVSYDILSRRGFALEALRRREEAVDAFEGAFHLAVSPEQRSAMARSQISNLVELRRTDEARALFDRYREAGVLDRSPATDIAYLASSVGDQRLARQYFQRAAADGTLRGRMLLDAAYNAKNVGEEDAAVRYFEAALAEDRAGTLQLEPQTRLNVTSEIRETGRDVGGYLSVARSPTGSFAGGPQGGADATYAGGEIFWRPPGTRTHLELFARAFMTLDQEEGATGPETTQGYLGVRVRPFLEYNLVFEASRLIPIGEFAQSDWLLRTGFGFGQGGGLRLDVPDWTEWSLFGELGQFIESGQTIANLEARYGRALRLGGVRAYTTVTPFIGARANYDSVFSDPFSIGAGPGVSFRRGLGAGPYRAPWSVLDLTLQYRFGLTGGDQAEGVYAGATLSY